MMKKKAVWGLVANLLVTPAAIADPQSDEALADRDRMEELERKVEILAGELERVSSERALGSEEPELESVFGQGPAASKIFQVGRGLSIGGYGEGFYQNIVSDKGTARDRADLLRMVLYAGYKFTDRILFNSEIEFEHASTSATESSGGGSVALEFATLDFLLADWANLRAGLVLVPMGFINKIHEPPYFFGVNRPEVERVLIPATWRENGAGLFGNIGSSLQYEAYVINGFNAEGFRASGVRGGRQNGNRALAEHLAFVGKLDWQATDSLLIGGSAYYGNSGQNQTVMGIDIPDTPTTIWEAHAQYRSHGFHARGLFTMTHLGDARELTTALRSTGELGPTESLSRQILGGYGEVAYDVLPLLVPGTEMSLEPFYRFAYYDTQQDVPSGLFRDRTQEITIHTAGLSFKPIPNVVIKADYRNRDSRSGNLPDEVNLGIGFAF